jgi:uncharacterized coiled-coil protein SlyX
MNRHAKKTAGELKQTSNLKETTAMKTVITSNSSLMTNLCSRSALIVIALALVAFVLAQKTQALNPPPDGGYPGGNSAEGQSALLNLTSGTFNTAIGFLSLNGLKEGNFNTGLGAGTLLFNVADENTATGAGALLSNTTGNPNTANGAFALFSNIDGTFNTATGDRVLFSNTAGSNNVGNGATALSSNTVGSDNTADGAFALVNNVTGNFNTADGTNALVHNTTGNNNIAVGFSAGDNLTTGDNNIDIGAEGVADESNTIRIGADQRGTFIAGIRGATTANANAIPVLIDSAGQLGTLSSSRRFKKEIKPMNKTSEGILDLKPVTFHYRGDATNTPQFGLIAEEVAEVNPNLVVRDNTGEIYTVRYEAVNAMLLNEFIKEHRKAQDQGASIAQLKSTVAKQEAAIVQQQKRMEVLTDEVKQQKAQIQNVSTQSEVAKPASQMALNHR